MRCALEFLAAVGAIGFALWLRFADPEPSRSKTTSHALVPTYRSDPAVAKFQALEAVERITVEAWEAEQDLYAAALEHLELEPGKRL